MTTYNVLVDQFWLDKEKQRTQDKNVSDLRKGKQNLISMIEA